RSTFMVVLRDVSERRRMEEHQRLLAIAGWVLAASLDFDSTLATIAELPLPLLGDWSLLELLTPEGAMKRAAAAHTDPTRSEVSSLIGRTAAAPTGVPPQASGLRIAHEGEPQRVTDINAWLVDNFAEANELEAVRNLG